MCYAAADGAWAGFSREGTAVLDVMIVDAESLDAAVVIKRERHARKGISHDATTLRIELAHHF